MIIYNNFCNIYEIVKAFDFELDNVFSGTNVNKGHTIIKYGFSSERIELLAVKYQLDDYQVSTCRTTSYRKSMLDIWQLHKQNAQCCMSNERV